MNTTTESRDYVIGLPVILTVQPDGRVTFEVDFGDTVSAIWDEYDGEQVEADIETIDAAIAAKLITPAAV